MVELILVEGAVGVGKTTTLERLSLYRRSWRVYPEPVKSWQEFPVGSPVEPVDLLARHYADPSVISMYRLQTAVNASLVGRYSRAHLQDPYRTKIFERSIRVAGEVFVPFGRGCMSPLDLCVMQAAAGELSDAYEKDAHHVYLFCSEPAMFNRIVERGRSAERHLSFNRLAEMKAEMDAWAARREFYTIDTTEKTPLEVARLIADWRDRGYKPPRADLLTVASPGESEGEEIFGTQEPEEAEASESLEAEESLDGLTSRGEQQPVGEATSS